MSVRMTPGRISLTVMPCGARRSAKSAVIIETPVFEMQYSPRLIEANSELAEAMLTIERRPPAIARSRRRRDHQSGDALGEEERPAQIDADDPVPALDARLEEIAAQRDLHAGIVDQAIDATESLPRRADQHFVAGEIADIAAQEHRLATARFDTRQRVADRLVLDDVVDDDIEPAIGQRPADRPADAAAATGDEGGRAPAHCHGHPIRYMKIATLASLLPASGKRVWMTAHDWPAYAGRPDQGGLRQMWKSKDERDDPADPHAGDAAQLLRRARRRRTQRPRACPLP